MPDDLAVQIPLVHAACEALGVPILTSEALRGRRCDRHAGHQGGRRRLRRRRRHDGQGLLSGSCTDGLRVFNPRDEGTWYDAAGVKEKFGVTPEQGRRRDGG